MTFRLAAVDGAAALVHGDHWFALADLGRPDLADPMAAIVAATDLHDLDAGLGDATPSGRLDEVVLGPPVPRPQKCFGIGLNYRAHADESRMEVPDAPLVFAKFPSCVVGPTAEVELRSGACDYEGELVVVIGTAGRDIAPERAWDHVVGLTVGQDISDRAMQFASKPPHFDLGKSFDTFGPIGPVLVSVDTVADPADLRVTTDVNGDVRQDDTTANLIFDVPTLIAYLSAVTTLVPGDLIFTGTPEGVGAASGRFLADGDVVTTTIAGIGTMVNRCIRVGS